MLNRVGVVSLCCAYQWWGGDVLFECHYADRMNCCWWSVFQLPFACFQNNNSYPRKPSPWWHLASYVRTSHATMSPTIQGNRLCCSGDSYPQLTTPSSFVINKGLCDRCLIYLASFDFGMFIHRRETFLTLQWVIDWVILITSVIRKEEMYSAAWREWPRIH